MRGVVMHAPGDVRVEDVDRPTIGGPTGAVVRPSATGVYGSGPWPHRGDGPLPEPVVPGGAAGVPGHDL